MHLFTSIFLDMVQGCHTLRELRELENLRKTHKILIYFLNSGKLGKFLIFLKKSGTF